MRAITADLAQLKHREIEDAARRQTRGRPWYTWGNGGGSIHRTQASLRANLIADVEVFTLPIRRSLKIFARS